MRQGQTLSLIDEDEEEEEEVVVCQDNVVWRSGRGGRNSGVWWHHFGGVRVGGVKRFRWIWGGRNDAIGSTPNPKTIEFFFEFFVTYCCVWLLRDEREVCWVFLFLFWVWLWEGEVWFWVCSCSLRNALLFSLIYFLLFYIW